MLRWPNTLGILVSPYGEDTVYTAESHLFLSLFGDHMQKISTDSLKALEIWCVV